MPPSSLPTSSPDALRNFVAGREQLRSYLTSGSGDQLQQAKQSFSAAATFDPRFQLAIFYRSLVESELREADAAILGFEELLKARTEFRTEVLLQLAYAHIKRYQDEDYFKAEVFLADARQAAQDGGRTDLQVFSDALKVFLYSVMGGRLSAKDRRPYYLEEAVKLGQWLLDNESSIASQPRNEARFEVMNGLGIAYMRKGQMAEDSSRQFLWTIAETRFSDALDLRPTSVRAMQNMGLLKGIRAFQALRDAREPEAQALFKQAKDWYARSLELNPNDQYPHYRMAQLCVLTDDWEAAYRYLRSGREQRGAVKDKEWSQLLTAMRNHDASTINW
jgi:tetratricopeptide (TPR) repeat protein